MCISGSRKFQNSEPSAQACLEQGRAVEQEDLGRKVRKYAGITAEEYCSLLQIYCTLFTETNFKYDGIQWCKKIQIEVNYKRQYLIVYSDQKRIVHRMNKEYYPG